MQRKVFSVYTMRSLLYKMIVSLFAVFLAMPAHAADDVYKGNDAPRIPYMMRMASNVGLCGSVLYNEQWAITAAHCVDAKRFGNDSPLVETVQSIRLYPGLYSMTGMRSAAYITVTQVFTVGNYTMAGKLDDDILVMRLGSPVTPVYSGTTPIIDYAPPITDVTKVNTPVSFYGWGDQGVEPRDPDLQQGDGVITGDSYDRIAFYGNCSGHGDSGGPLVGNGRLMGILSSGDNRCNSGFVRISHYWQEISAIMQRPTVTGTAFIDLNSNGQFDNEPTVANIDIIATSFFTPTVVIPTWTDANGNYTVVLTPGRWLINAYHNFDMVFDADYQIDGDTTIMIPLPPQKLYLPLVTK